MSMPTRTRGASSFSATKAKTHFFKNDDLSTVLEPSSDAGTFTGTKIMATMGPSIHDTDVIGQLLEDGMVAGRVDLTWGPLEFHRNSLAHLKEAMTKTKRMAASVLDTMGRELMIRGEYQVNDQGYPWVLGSRNVVADQALILSSNPDAVASDTLLPVMYAKFHLMAQKGDNIQIARYLVSGAESSSLYLTVTDVVDTEVHVIAQNDALLEGLLCVFHAERSGGGGVANIQNELPLLCDWDKECLTKLGAEFEIDFVNLSYCRNAEDVQEARSFLDSINMQNCKIMAKIESRLALQNLTGILNAADGIVFSRGNIGLDIEAEKMALIQKAVIKACNLVGKPIFITRVVDTMVNTPRPTRAEATDVANAVLDGCDGIMLGAETLRGKYPVETVQTVASICRAAEAVFGHSSHYEYLVEAAWEAVQTQHKTWLDRADSIASQMEQNAKNKAAEAVFDHSSHYEYLVEAAWEAVQTQHETDRADSIASQMVQRGQVGDKPYDATNKSIHVMAKFSMAGSIPNLKRMDGTNSHGDGLDSMLDGENSDPHFRAPFLSKLESIASSAVRAADKLQASLIIVYTHTGQTLTELVAKYRPPVPIMTLVVPQIVTEKMKWKLVGSTHARHCLLVRGLMPVLATPSHGGEALLKHSVASAHKKGIVKPGDHVVVVQMVNDYFCLKVITVDESGMFPLTPRLNEAMVSLGALKPGDHVVVGQMVGDDFCLKVITADK
eukprot:gene8473-4834_t